MEECREREDEDERSEEDDLGSITLVFFCCLPFLEFVAFTCYGYICLLWTSDCQMASCIASDT